MPRIGLIQDPADVAAEFRHIAEAIVSSRGRVTGPFMLLLHSPEIAGRVAELGGLIRFQSTLAPADRELAIIATAQERRSEYEWRFHTPIALRAGVREEALAAVRDDAGVQGLEPREAVILRYVRELCRTNQVSHHTFGEGTAHFSTQQLVELTVTVGYYSMLAAVLNSFELTSDAELPSE